MHICTYTYAYVLRMHAGTYTVYTIHSVYYYTIHACTFSIELKTTLTALKIFQCPRLSVCWSWYVSSLWIVGSSKVWVFGSHLLHLPRSHLPLFIYNCLYMYIIYNSILKGKHPKTASNKNEKIGKVKIPWSVTFLLMRLVDDGAKSPFWMKHANTIINGSNI